MATQRKSRSKNGGKCKIAGRRRRDISPPSTFSADWMGSFVKTVGRTGNLKAALEDADLGIVEFERARREDPAFHAACIEIDLAVRASIQRGLEAEAAAGNVGAARLLSRGLGLLQSDPNESADPPDVVRAMLDAKRRVEMGEETIPWSITDVVCPCCRNKMTLEIRHAFKGATGKFFYEVLLMSYGSCDRSMPTNRWSSAEDPFCKEAVR